MARFNVSQSESARCRDEDQTCRKVSRRPAHSIEESARAWQRLLADPVEEDTALGRRVRRRAIENHDVAVSNGGVDEPRSVRIRLDLSSEPPDRVVNGPREPWIRKFPQVAQELVAPNDLTRAFGQVLQQVEFTMGEMDLLAAHDGPCAPGS